MYPWLHRQLTKIKVPGTAVFELFGQFKQTVLFFAMTVVEYFPSGQSMHVLTVVAPTFIEYLPVAQLRHVLTVVAAIV